MIGSVPSRSGVFLPDPCTHTDSALRMIRLERVVLHEIQLSLVEPFQISSGTVEDRRILLLELVTSDGVVGWSECVAAEQPNYSPETIDTAFHALERWLVPTVLRLDSVVPSEAKGILDERVRGHRMAKAALEMGLFVVQAEMESRPLARLLGGSRSSVATGVSLGIQESPEILAERARREFEKGYRKIKVKIAPGADLSYVAAVRRALPDAHLMADANSAYSLEDADHLVRLDDFDLLMIEQPLDREDLVRHARLQERLRTPICLDESITSLDRAEDMVALGSGRIVNIKPGRVGGFSESLAIHDLCREEGLDVWCGGMLETGIGRACNVALASLPGFTLPGDLSPSARYWERDIVDPPWTMDDQGMVRVPMNRPGLGVSVDEAAIERLTTRRLVLNRADVESAV